MDYLKAYIAGPMRGIVDYNRTEFFKAASKLEDKHIYKVVNPCDSDSESGLTDAELNTSEGLRIVMARDLTDICSCDIMYMLNGWEKSEGARIEHSLATMLNMTIIYQ